MSNGENLINNNILKSDVRYLGIFFDNKLNFEFSRILLTTEDTISIWSNFFEGTLIILTLPVNKENTYEKDCHYKNVALGSVVDHGIAREKTKGLSMGVCHFFPTFKHISFVSKKHICGML